MEWKKTLAEEAASLFENKHDKKPVDEEALVKRLYQQIGKLKVEKDFLEDSLGRMTWKSGARLSIANSNGFPSNASVNWPMLTVPVFIINRWAYLNWN